MDIAFDKNILIEYIKENKDDKFNIYCVNVLYKNYNLINRLTNNDPISKLKMLNELEDYIYTINGKKIDDIKRILLELSIIKKSLKNKEINKDIIFQIDLLKNSVNELNYYTPEKVFDVKKQVSILQAKLGIKPSFLFASYCAFEDIYKSLLIKRETNEIGIK